MVDMQAPVCKKQAIIVLFLNSKIYTLLYRNVSPEYTVKWTHSGFELNSIFYWDHHMDNYLSENFNCWNIT